MQTRIAFNEFAQALDESNVSAGATEFLEDAAAAWAGLLPEEQLALLQHFGFEADAATVNVRLEDDPEGRQGVEHIAVVIEAEDAGPADEMGLALVDEAPEAEPEAALATEADGFEEIPAERALAEALEQVEESEPEPPVQAEDPAPEPAAEADAPEPAAPAEPVAAAEAEPEPVEAEAEAPGKKGRFKGMFGRFAKAKAEEEAPFDGVVTEIPPLTDPDHELVEIYAVQEPYAYIRIINLVSQNEHLYQVIEPKLTEREENILAFIENTIVDIIEVGLEELTQESATELLRKHVDEVVYDYSIVLSQLSREKLMYYILRDFLGFGILDPIMRDDYIEDVSCDGPKVPIFLYHRKYESIRSDVLFADDREADSYVIKMAQRSGKHVSIAEPLLDATLPDGSRLNATLSHEVTAGGSTFTIRKFREDPFTIPDLVRFGTMNEELLAYWWLAVQNGASAIYAGGTASGKTTSLNAILLFIPPQMKIVSIEDTREINIPHENWIAGVTRSGFGPRDHSGRQAGEIDMFTLLKAALRQRPEYILVGEVRGTEATALFQAMATGHTAYGTMHADSAEAVIHRLESEPISIPRSLLEALDIVSIQIQTRIGDRRVRRTKELVEIVGLDPHTREILTNEVFSWSPATDKFEFSGVSYVLERIQMERNISEHDLKEEFDRRRRVISYMVRNNIRALKDVGRIIATYYKDPAAVMAIVDADIPPEASPIFAAAGGGPAEPAPLEVEIAGALPAAQPKAEQKAKAAAKPTQPASESMALVEVEEDADGTE